MTDIDIERVCFMAHGLISAITAAHAEQYRGLFGLMVGLHNYSARWIAREQARCSDLPRFDTMPSPPPLPTEYE